MVQGASRSSGHPSQGQVLSMALNREQAEAIGSLLLSLGEQVVGLSRTTELDGWQVELVSESGALVALVDERGLVRLLGTESKAAETVEQAARNGVLRILNESTQLKRSQQRKLKGVATRLPPLALGDRRVSSG